MNLIAKIGELFFDCVLNVVEGAPYLCMLLVAAWICAVIFNLIFEFSEV